MRIVPPIPFLFLFCGSTFFFGGGPKKFLWGVHIFFSFFSVGCTIFLFLEGVQKHFLVRVQKGLLKGPCTHWGPLSRLSEANTCNPNYPWAILNQTQRLKAFQTLKNNLRPETYFPLKERHNSRSFWKQLCPANSPIYIVGWFKIQTIL